MLKIALTGGIASGKTRVAEFFAAKQIPIVDADESAREVVAKDTAAFTKIIEHFGSQVLNKEQALNRAVLREIIFADDTERLWLEQLLHPLIADNMWQKIQQLENTAPYLVSIIPLLSENSDHKFYDRVLVVETDPQIQLQRIIARDKIDAELAQAMINSQADNNERLAMADDIIHNHGKLIKLATQVDALHNKYIELSD